MPGYAVELDTLLDRRARNLPRHVTGYAKKILARTVGARTICASTVGAPMVSANTKSPGNDSGTGSFERNDCLLPAAAQS